MKFDCDNSFTSLDFTGVCDTGYDFVFFRPRVAFVAHFFGFSSSSSSLSAFLLFFLPEVFCKGSLLLHFAQNQSVSGTADKETLHIMHQRKFGYPRACRLTISDDRHLHTSHTPIPGYPPALHLYYTLHTHRTYQGSQENVEALPISPETCWKVLLCYP